MKRIPGINEVLASKILKYMKDHVLDNNGGRRLDALPAITTYEDGRNGKNELAAAIEALAPWDILKKCSVRTVSAAISSVASNPKLQECFYIEKTGILGKGKPKIYFKNELFDPKTCAEAFKKQLEKYYSVEQVTQLVHWYDEVKKDHPSGVPFAYKHKKEYNKIHEIAPEFERLLEKYDRGKLSLSGLANKTQTMYAAYQGQGLQR